MRGSIAHGCVIIRGGMRDILSVTMRHPHGFGGGVSIYGYYGYVFHWLSRHMRCCGMREISVVITTRISIDQRRERYPFRYDVLRDHRYYLSLFLLVCSTEVWRREKM